jgi:hypothetical protein
MAKATWWDRLYRLDTLTALGQLAWQYLVLLLIGGGVMGYLAFATEWLNQWGPIAWGVAFCLGAIVVALLATLWAIIDERRARKQLTQALVERPQSINLLEPTFEFKTISLNDLFFPLNPRINRKFFRKFRFIGPGILFLGDKTKLSHSSFGPCTFIATYENTKTFGVISVEDSTLTECEFYNGTFLLVSNVADELVADLRKAGVELPVIGYKGKKQA